MFVLFPDQFDCQAILHFWKAFNSWIYCFILYLTEKSNNWQPGANIELLNYWTTLQNEIGELKYWIIELLNLWVLDWTIELLGYWTSVWQHWTIEWLKFNGVQTSFIHYSSNEVLHTWRQPWRAKRQKLSERCAGVDFPSTGSY